MRGARWYWMARRAARADGMLLRLRPILTRVPRSPPPVIVPRTSREEILAKLNKKRDANQPIWIASAGSGLVAKLLEGAGVDCINTFSGARLRANGMGTMSMLWPILDSNKQTIDYTYEDILPAMSGDAFVCACINANDPAEGHGRRARAAARYRRRIGVEHRPVDQLRRQGQPDLQGAEARAASPSRTRSSS